MAAIKTLDDLRKMREQMQTQISLREKSDQSENLIQIKVAMATCGIAAGAREIMEAFITQLDTRKINAIVTQTGCMGFCYAEPTIEILIPGQEPVIYGQVDKQKVQEIIDRHLLRNELVDGIIPISFRTIEDKD